MKESRGSFWGKAEALQIGLVHRSSWRRLSFGPGVRSSELQIRRRGGREREEMSKGLVGLGFSSLHGHAWKGDVFATEEKEPRKFPVLLLVAPGGVHFS